MIRPPVFVGETRLSADESATLRRIVANERRHLRLRFERADRLLRLLLGSPPFDEIAEPVPADGGEPSGAASEVSE